MTESEAKIFAETHSQNALGITVNAAIDPATVGDEDDRDVVVSIFVDEKEIEKIILFGHTIFDGIQTTVTIRSVVN